MILCKSKLSLTNWSIWIRSTENRIASLGTKGLQRIPDYIETIIPHQIKTLQQTFKLKVGKMWMFFHNLKLISPITFKTMLLMVIIMQLLYILLTPKLTLKPTQTMEWLTVQNSMLISIKETTSKATITNVAMHDTRIIGKQWFLRILT